jgi:6-phosphogluconolactonase (cycloisomerase 2 family)
LTSATYYYVTNRGGNTIAGYAVNTNNGLLDGLKSPPGVTGPQPISCASALTGTPGTPFVNQIYVADLGDGFITQFAQDPQSGALTVANDQVDSGATGLNSIATSFYDYLYATGAQGLYGFNIDPSTGFLTALSNSPVAAGTGPGAVATFGFYVYVVNVTDGTVSAFIQNTATGQLTAVAGGAVKTGKAPSAIVVTSRPNFFPIG